MISQVHSGGLNNKQTFIRQADTGEPMDIDKINATIQKAGQPKIASSSLHTEVRIAFALAVVAYMAPEKP